jgi:hypothetical protein
LFANVARVEKQSITREDYNVLKVWVKEELFEKVKFLYNQSVNLKVNGKLYNKFVRDCKDRLSGGKRPGSDSESERMYLELLWTTANGKKKNMVTMGLTTKRSTVFGSMQNQFTGRYSAGVRDELVLCFLTLQLQIFVIFVPIIKQSYQVSKPLRRDWRYQVFITSSTISFSNQVREMRVGRMHAWSRAQLVIVLDLD